MDEVAERAVRAALARTHDDARAAIQRGVVMIALIPMVAIVCGFAALLLGPFSALISLLLTAVYTLIGGIVGLAWIAGGVVDQRRCSRELRALDDVRKLPEARLLR